MKIQLKILAITLCALCCLSAKSEENTLCTTSVIDNAIKTEYAGNKEILDIWETLETKTLIRIKDRDAKIRPPMVTMQSIMESKIASLLKDGTIKYAKAVIYTPLPSIPLRATTFNIDTLVRKDFYKDSNRVKTITARRNSLQEYLTNGGMLYHVYKEIEPEKQITIPGLSNYKDNLDKYKTTLIDKPTDTVNTRYTGASYIAECSNGTKLFFAIKGRQANDVRKKQWALYYGKLDKKNKKLKRYFKRLRTLYEDADVTFNFR